MEYVKIVSPFFGETRQFKNSKKVELGLNGWFGEMLIEIS
jgi:hypothetical protein